MRWRGRCNSIGFSVQGSKVQRFTGSEVHGFTGSGVLGSEVHGSGYSLILSRWFVISEVKAHSNRKVKDYYDNLTLNPEPLNLKILRNQPEGKDKRGEICRFFAD
jgi:hypothetical protein